MANPIEQIKGRLKEAIGALGDKESLKREGEAQQRKEEKVDEAADALEQARRAETQQRANQ